MVWIWVYFLQEDKCETPVIFHKPTLHSPTYLSPANNGAILNCTVVTLGYVPQSTIPNRNLSTLPFHRWANWGRRQRNEDFILQQHCASLAFITEVSQARLKKKREKGSFRIWSSDLLLISCVTVGKLHNLSEQSLSLSVKGDRKIGLSQLLHELNIT